MRIDIDEWVNELMVGWRFDLVLSLLKKYISLFETWCAFIIYCLVRSNNIGRRQSDLTDSKFGMKRKLDEWVCEMLN